MNKVHSIAQKMYGRSSVDELNDLDVNTALWGIFVNVTLEAAVHLDQDHMENLRFSKKQLLKSVKEFFQMTEKLIKDHKEINNLTTIDYKEFTWRSTTLDYECQNLCLRRLRALSGKHE